MEKNEKNLLKLYFRWPLFLGFVLIGLCIAVLFIDPQVAIYLIIFTITYFVLAIAIYLAYRKKIRHALFVFEETRGKWAEHFIEKLEMPVAICNGEKEIYFGNKSFREIFNPGGKEIGLSQLFPEMENQDFDKKRTYSLPYEGRQYELEVRDSYEELPAEIQNLTDSEETKLYALHFLDVTEMLNLKQQLEDEKSVLAIVYWDNYEEAMSETDSARKAIISALFERMLVQYADSIHAVLRKLEKDRFFMAMSYRVFREMKENRYPILTAIKSVKTRNGVAPTLSMGVGLGGNEFDQNYSYARTAIDMALGRGGDQVVVKNGTQITYFGGKAETAERNTKVKARVKAKALRELIEAKENVIIMGHPISDFDCLGAAVGIYRIAAFSQRPVNIVLSEVSSSIKPLLGTFKESEEYPEDMFITGEEAKGKITDRTLLIVVDTNRPTYTSCPELLKKAKNRVIMDHHRPGKDIIENPVLSYIEPYASSASELVTEMIQYYDDSLRLKRGEADALFAGIVMDTNNFEDKSGVRTFEAAAYLRRSGTNTNRVRKLFRDSMEDYKLRAETISKAEVYKNDYVISVCPVIENNPNQTVVAAQAANELLMIRGIKASFVITEFENKVYVSARSIDEMNVQTMMEKLGGGGHQSVAGAQFEGATIEEVKAKVQEVIDAAMEEDAEIEKQKEMAAEKKE